MTCRRIELRFKWIGMEGVPMDLFVGVVAAVREGLDDAEDWILGDAKTEGDEIFMAMEQREKGAGDEAAKD